MPRPCKLTATQCDVLRTLALTGFCAHDLLAWCDAEWGVKYTLLGMYNLLVKVTGLPRHRFNRSGRPRAPYRVQAEAPCSICAEPIVRHPNKLGRTNTCSEECRAEVIRRYAREYMRTKPKEEKNAWHKWYGATEKGKAAHIEYRQRQDVKERARQRAQRPDVKEAARARKAAHRLDPEWVEKRRAYDSKPEVVARATERRRARALAQMVTDASTIVGLENATR